jgi:hypothetical protein
MLRSIKSPQRMPRQLHFKVDGTGGSASLLIGSKDASVVRSAQGRYTITFEQPFARECVAIPAVVYGSAGIIASVESSAAGSVAIRIYDAAGADQDADFHLMVQGFDAADEY